MIILTNRAINEEKSDHDMLGLDFNPRSPFELRLIRANKANGKWKLELLPEPEETEVVSGEKKWPSHEEFLRIMKTKKDVVFFVHGNNQTPIKNLEKAHKIEKNFGVEVIVFSWPSRPPHEGIPLWEKKKRYKIAIKNAEISKVALDKSFEKLNDYLQLYSTPDCTTSISLIVHSLGNYLFKSLIISPEEYRNETSIFTNIILHQADTHANSHEKWVDEIAAGQRVYITINEHDSILKLSEKIHGKERVGNKDRGLNSNQAYYINLTNAPDVHKSHDIFVDENLLESNTIIRTFFLQALKGEKAHNFLTYNATRNFYYQKEGQS